MTTIVTAPSHTKAVFDISTMPLIVRWAEEICYRHKADAIVGCGHSGLVIAGALSYATRIPVIAVRKEGEPVVAGGSGASKVSAVLNNKAKRWVWIDDLLCSGGTFRHAVQELWRARVVESPAPEALLCYNRSKDWMSSMRSDDTYLRLDEYPGEIPDSIPHYGFGNW